MIRVARKLFSASIPLRATSFVWFWKFHTFLAIKNLGFSALTSQFTDAAQVYMIWREERIDNDQFIIVGQ